MSNSSLFAKRLYAQGRNLAAATNVTGNWTKIDSGDALTADAVTLPDGRLTGSLSIAGDSTSGQHGVRQTIGLTANTYMLTAKVKAGNKTVVFFGRATGNLYGYFNLSTGRRGTMGASAVGKIRKLTGGWYMIYLRITGTLANYALDISPVDADASTTMTGGNGSTVNLYVADFSVQECQDAGSTLGDYAPVLSTDDGGLVVGGIDANNFSHAVRVSHANESRSVDTPVLCVQTIDASGVVGGGSLTNVTATVATTAALEALLVAGTTPGGKQQPFYLTTGKSLICTVNIGATTSTNISHIHTHTSATVTKLTSANVHLANVSTDTSAAAASLAVIDNVIATVAAAVKTQSIQICGTDGTNARTIKTDSSGNVSIIFGAARPGEDAVNDWLEVCVQSHAHGNTDTASVTAGTATTVGTFIATTAVGTYENFTMWAKNTGTVALSTVRVYASRNGTDWTEVSIMRTSVELLTNTLAAGATGIVFMVSENPGWRYVKATAAVGSGHTHVIGGISYQT